MRVARSLVAAAVIALTALASACESGGGEDNAAVSSAVPNVPATPAASARSSAPADGPTGSSAPPKAPLRLSLEQIRTVLVTTADVPGYRVDGEPGLEEAPDHDGRTIDKAECEPLMQLMASDRPHGHIDLTVSVVKADQAMPDVVHIVGLRKFKAEATLKDLMAKARAAVPACSTYVVGDGAGAKTTFRVRPAARQPTFGDSLAFEVASDRQSEFVPLYFARSHIVLVTATGITQSMTMKETPIEIVRAQYEKLVRAQAGG